MWRKHNAEWIRHTHLFSADEYECSDCGGTTNKPKPTCPHCGASMGGEQYDPSWVDEAAMLDIILGDK